MTFTTSQLCDQYSDEVQTLDPILQDFGGRRTFTGRIVTLDTFEDDGLVRQILSTSGDGQVLVIDGGGSVRAALLDAELARMARENGWVGIVIHGGMRNAAEIANLDLGVRALNATPCPGHHRGRGAKDAPLHFGSVSFRDGYYLYADADGIVVAARDLLSGT
jgi:regulator of ribonuclease activity A